MAAIAGALRDARTYRRLLFALSPLALGPSWFAALVSGWSVCVGLAITPLVILVLIGMFFLIKGIAALEAAIVRWTLGVELEPPLPVPTGERFWPRFRAMLGAGFWKAQAYVLIRAVPGFALAVALLSLLGISFGMISAPVWVSLSHTPPDLASWRPHTVWQGLVFVPFGLVLLPSTILAGAALGGAFGPLARMLLGSAPGPSVAASREGRSVGRVLRNRGVEIHATVDAGALLVLIAIWALTSRGYFWPVWVALPLASALTVHAWVVVLARDGDLVRRFRGSRALAITVGVLGVLFAYLVAIWAITGHGYFWPVWPLLAFAIAAGALFGAVVLRSAGKAEMAQRISTLESSRAGAVDVQESELRRIERDLHDGAQARLVALGMSLGMAEQKLAEEPERAGELLAEARVGAEQSLRELRDLARGIHPPVLGDRGLEAAVAALANTTPLQVNVSGEVSPRPASTVESAAYFVVAETLANAAKHARAARLEIRMSRVGDVLQVEVEDDGVGGADPRGSGLSGLRQRVEALDGRLRVTSPEGGPTRIRAELPCGR